MNYSITPIKFRNNTYNSIKDAIDKTGLSRYLIKKEAVYINDKDSEKFANFGRSKTIYQIPSKEELEKVYKGNIRKAAKQLKISKDLAEKLIDEYDIKRISLSEAKVLKSDQSKPSKKELIAQYEKMSIDELLSHYKIGHNKLMRWFKSYNIKVRPLGETAAIKHNKRHENIKPSYDELNEQYQKNNMYEIAKNYGVGKNVVSNWLIEYGIDVNTNKSRGETDLYEYCKSLDDSFIQSDRKLIAPFEIDILSHKHKLCIEYCGIYWHSEALGKTKQYHRNKYLECKKLGYTLLTVFESDDINKIKALIRTKLNKNTRVYGRNTIVKEISAKDSNEFHEKHHLSGKVGAKVHLGLYYKDTLVMVASFSKSRYNKKFEYECARMTSDSSYTVVGGASKLFKYFFTQYNIQSCVTYSDLRFGEGLVYMHCGFTRQKDSSPNYFYFNTNDFVLQSRVKYQKHKLSKILNKYDPLLSESDNMINNGYHRIWDCGNAVYTYYK